LDKCALTGYGTLVSSFGIIFNHIVLEFYCNIIQLI